MHSIFSPLSPGNIALFEKNISTKKIIRSYKKFDINISNYFKDISEISIYKCQTTGYRFYYPYNISGNNEFYKHFQQFNWYYMPWKWEHQITLRYLNPDSRILEIGCAHGAFLSRITNMINLPQATGIELNESTKTENERWKILNVDIFDFQKTNENVFDVVCSFQVLEHISNVHDFLESNMKCLKIGGKLIISVPNNDSFLNNSPNCLNEPPHHMGLWNSESLKSITTIFPLKLIQIHTEELQSYHVDDYIYANFYSKYPLLIGKIIREFHKYIGQYRKQKTKVLKNKDTILGQTILAIYEKL
jgi:2-polyprenyl-3-methyl-5-hydroxy-6-metoxy-1,4-benzoquinol methylase